MEDFPDIYIESPIKDERNAEAVLHQRRQRLDTLVNKRKANFAYLKKIHEGNSFWLNSVSMSAIDIRHFLALNGTAWERLLSYFYLGLSFGKILECATGFELVRESLRLFDEWEYYFSTFSVQSVKYIMARNVPTAFPDVTDYDISRQTINKFNNDILFERLLTPHVGFDLDYVAVMQILCEVLSKIYENIWSEECYRFYFISVIFSTI